MSASKKTSVALAVLIIAATTVIYTLPKGDENEVIVLCGGSMRAVLEDIIKQYSAVSDVDIVPSYGGSGELCAQIQKTGRGDIYLCHDPFMPWAAERNLISEWDTMGYLDVVMITPKGNPKKILEIEDLSKPGTRLGIGNRIYSTSGVIANDIINRSTHGAAIIDNIRVETKGHQQRCSDVIMGTLDVGIVWKAVAHLFQDKLDIIPIADRHIHAVTSATYGKSDLKNVKITIGIIARAKGKKATQDFYRYVTTQRRDTFEKHNFRTKEVSSIESQ